MMTNEARQALRLRLLANKASIKKLPAILSHLSPDDRLRYMYAFYKAHTGRWAGRVVQLQNLKAARTKDEKAMIAAVIKMLEAGREVPDLNVLSLVMRPLITAPKGKNIVLADFKSVENRVLAWAAGCEPMLQVYWDGKDPYIYFAARMEGCDYSEVTAEMRQQAKPGTLGCGFGLGGGQLVRKCKCSCKHVWNIPATANEETKAPAVACPVCGKEVTPGLVSKTGLWRYAEMMGIDLSQEKAQAQVEAFRETFMDVAQWWYHLEQAFAACCKLRRNQTITSTLGDGVPACRLVFAYKAPALRIVLPSGRELIYPSAYTRSERNRYGTEKLTLGFETERGHSWGVQHTYGGRLCENIVQAIARDCLAEVMCMIEPTEDNPVTVEMLAAQALGVTPLQIIGHTHDELLCLADETDTTAQARLEGYMSITPAWAPGLILGADGHTGRRYEKA